MARATSSGTAQPLQGNVPRARDLGVPCLTRLGLVLAHHKAALPLAEFDEAEHHRIDTDVGANSRASDFTRFCTPARAAAVATMYGSGW